MDGSMPLAAFAATLFAFAPIVVATYTLGTAILALGLIVAFRRDISRARGLDKLICLGPVFFAAPLAVFSGEHFTVTRQMTSMVPPWIPWHFFWVLFVGVALLSAALSMAAGRVTGLAAALLGVMFLLFVALMDVPYGVVVHPHDRFAWTLMLRELCFGLCALALASTFAEGRWHPPAVRVATVARVVVGATMVFYGVEHFLHPQFVPVIPLEMQLPAWIPLHLLWGYGTGAVEVAAGLAMVSSWHARMAASILGLAACIDVLLVYLPILAVHPADIDVGMNYFADTLCFAGALLVLAGSIAPRPRQRTAAPVPVAEKFQHS
jgi:uncharacterized membrane protein